MKTLEHQGTGAFFVLKIREEGGIPMAGRKPKPTAVKKLEGNPGKRKLNKNEPVPAKGMPTCPDWLMPEAKKEWERLAELMNQMGVLTEVDMAAFAAYCQSYARWKEAQEHITAGGSGRCRIYDGALRTGICKHEYTYQRILQTFDGRTDYSCRTSCFEVDGWKCCD